MMPNHTVTLGGLPLYTPDSVGPFEWRLQPGPFPYRASFLVPRQVGPSFVAKRGVPLNLTINPSDGTSVTIKNVYILAVVDIYVGEAPMSRVTIADLRWKWRGKTVTGFFNHLRRLNDADVIRNGEELRDVGQVIEVAGLAFERPSLPGGFAPVQPSVPAVPNQIQPPAVEFRPKDVVAESLQVIPAYMYRDITCNGSTKKPWTAFELLVGILRGYSVPSINGVDKVIGILDSDETLEIDKSLVDNGYPVPPSSYMADDVRVVLASLCKLARCRIYVNVHGKVVLYPVDQKEFIKPANNDAVPINGILYTVDQSIERPSAIRVAFKQERELEFFTAKKDSTVNVKEFPMQNVIQLPASEILQLEGDSKPREYGIGSIVPYGDALFKAWRITESQIRRWFNKPFEQLYALHLGILSSTLQGMIPTFISKRVSAIKNSYRQLFQLPAHIVNVLMDLKGESLIVLDPISGQRAPSSVWSDYGLILNHKNIPIVKAMMASSIKADSMVVNVNYNKKPGSSKPAENEPPGPFVVEVVDPGRGLVRLHSVPDQIGWMQEIVPSNVEPTEGIAEPFRAVNKLPLDWTNTALTEHFHAALRVTAVVARPNTIDQLKVYEIKPPAGVAAFGPVYTVFVRNETARVDKDGRVVNERIVKALAFAEAMLIYQSWQDHLAGKMSWRGVHIVPLQGYAAGVIYSMTNEGFWHTTLDMSEPLVPFTAEQLLPTDLQYQRNRLLPPQ